MSWLTYKGIHSDAMDLVVVEYPPITRAEQRVERVKIPGRHGEVTLMSGPPVYEAYVRECECAIKPGADIGALSAWLTGRGDVVFGNEPEFIYEARLDHEVSFEKIMREREDRELTLPFLCQPLKKKAEADIVLTTSGNVVNPGHVTSTPIIKVEGSGDIALLIGLDSTTHIKGLAEPILIDSELGIATNLLKTQNASYLVSGDWPLIAPGTVPVSWTGTVTRLTITPRWRWL